MIAHHFRQCLLFLCLLLISTVFFCCTDRAAMAFEAEAVTETPVVLTEILVTGNTHIPSTDILAALPVHVGDTCTEQQVRALRTAVMELGWFEEVSLTREVTDIGCRLTIHVVENPVITGLRIEGATVLPPETLIALMQTKPGQAFNNRLLSQDAKALAAYYRERGYAFALVGGQHMSTEGVLTLTMVEGAIEAVEVKGNTRTRDDFIRHYIRIKPGDVYNYQAVNADMMRLYKTELFETMQQQVETGNEYGKVIVVITVVEKAHVSRADIAGSYSSTYGLAGTFGITRTNFQGRGRTLSLRTKVGGIGGYECFYADPWIATPETRLAMGVYDTRVFRDAYLTTDTDAQTIGYREHRVGGYLTLSRPTSERTTVTMGLRNHHTELVADKTEEQQLLTGPEFAPTTVRSITTSVATDVRDNPLAPRRGTFSLVSAEFSGLLGGGAEFAKYSADHRRYVPVGKKGTFALRVLGGTITSDAPYLEQFLLGGGETLRGFRNDRFAGNHLALVNAEYRFPLTDKITVVSFVDVGDAWGGSLAAHPLLEGDPQFTAHIGYGVGLRVSSPLGPIRFDIGFSEEGAESHFGFSQVF